MQYLSTSKITTFYIFCMHASRFIKKMCDGVGPRNGNSVFCLTYSGSSPPPFPMLFEDDIHLLLKE
jgi:hypothetical protein